MNKITSWQTTFMRELEKILNRHMIGLNEVPEGSCVRIDALKWQRLDTDQSDEDVRISFDDVLIRVSRQDEADVPVFHPNRFKGNVTLERRLVYPTGHQPRGLYRMASLYFDDKFMPAN